MLNGTKNFFVLGLVVFISNFIYADPADSLKLKIGALPSAFYTPETRLGFGGLIYTYFRTVSDSGITKKSNTQTYLTYTLNKQFSFQNDYQIFSKNNLFYLTGAIDYSKYPEFFYGIGNDTKENERIMISFDVVKINSKNLVQINNYLYGGIDFQYQKLYNQDIKLKYSPMGEDIPGGMGYTASGLGPIFIFDKRDNPLNPEKGEYIETAFVSYHKTIGSHYKFYTLIIDARKYNTFYKRLVWNGNLYLSFNKGEVPYRMLSVIGGARFLRGYYEGRFRDNNMIIIQQELRTTLYKRLGVAAFGGIGEVAKKINDFSKNEIHYDFGIGLRIKINKKENTNLRIDYGITKDSQGIYVVFAEAF